MEQLTNLIIEYINNARVRFRPIDSVDNISFDKKGVFTIKGQFKCADTNIPMSNLAGRVEGKVEISIHELSHYCVRRQFN